jgi:hypothetical protein
MGRAHPLLVLPAVLLLLLSCSPDPLTSAGIQGENTLSLVRDLASAYERKDIESFMDKLSPSFPDREGFRGSLENVFSSYQTIRQKVQYTRLLITVPAKGDIILTFTWEGEWRSSDGKIIKDGARSSLLLDKATYKLSGVEGKNPYLPVQSPLPVRQ